MFFQDKNTSGNIQNNFASDSKRKFFNPLKWCESQFKPEYLNSHK